MFPSIESAGRRFAFLHRVLRGEFPCFHGTIKALRLPAAHPAALRCLRLAVPRWHSRDFAPRRPSAPPRPGVGHPVSPSGNLRGDKAGSPKFLGNLNCPSARVLTDAGRTAAPDHYSAAAWPLDPQVQRLPRKVFRRPIAWLSDSLSTLRRTGYPATTQDSLPVAGQALPDGLSTHKTPMKGFRSASYISSSSPKLCLAQAGWPWAVARPGLPQTRTCAH